MLSNKTIIQGQWKKISAAGEDGNTRINKNLGSSMPSVLIVHTDSAQPAGSPAGDNIPLATAVDLSIEAAYLQPNDRISDGLYSDNGNDIYYATVLGVDQSVELVVDFG